MAIEVPQTCGARHVRQDMATLGAIHPPLWAGISAGVVGSCILSYQTGRILEDSQGFDNGSAAPTTKFLSLFPFLENGVGNLNLEIIFSSQLFLECCFFLGVVILSADD